MATPAGAVDVRDMMCAQALALIAQALARLANGQALEIRYNADDVKRDVLAWARDAGHRVEERTPATLSLRRGTS
jgi:TusA-related sulfurtransferase